MLLVLALIFTLAGVQTVGAQAPPGTKFINDSATGGDCTLIGAWDAATKTCTLTADLTVALQIDSNGITLDGNGKTITGANTGNGVYLNGKTGVTVKNLNVRQFTYGIYLFNSSTNTLTGNTAISNSNSGIFLALSSSNTLTGNTASSNSYAGIYLYSFSTGNTLSGNTASSNNYGIYLSSSSTNTLTGNTARSNSPTGILLSSSNSNTLSGNTADSNNYGIYLVSSTGNTLTGNAASSNTNYGIYLSSSGSNSLSGNIMSGNKYNFYLSGVSDADHNNTIDTTNKVDNRPIYYIKNASTHTYDATTNAGVFYCVNCDNITVSGLTPTRNHSGVYLWKTRNSRIENVNATGNYYGVFINQSNGNTLSGNTASSNINYGIYLNSSSGNTLSANTVSSNWSGIYLNSSSSNSLTGNIAISNSPVGIYLVSSTDNTLSGNTFSSNYYGTMLYLSTGNTVSANTANHNTYGIYLNSSSNGNTLSGNTVSSNPYGIYLYGSTGNTINSNTASSNSTGIYVNISSNNQVYNNSFIGNTTQAYVTGGAGNIFSKPAPAGGNYWNNYDTPAEGCNNLNGDSFCDAKYTFTGSEDILPWTTQNGWLDSIAPTTTDNSPAAWQKPDFTVSLTCADNPGGSGCKETKYRVDGGAWQTSNSVIINTNGDHLIEYYSSDNAGNQEAAKSVHAKLDKTAPTISASAKKADNSAYTTGTWTNQNVTVHYDCADTGGSGLVSCTSDQTFSTTTATTSGTATDNAGNNASASFGPINIDKTKPTISASATVNGSPYVSGTWTNQIVTVKFTCGDIGGSVLAGSCPADRVFSAEGIFNSNAATVSDNAGNISDPANTFSVKVDKTSPVVTITSPANGAHLIQGEIVLAGWSASDALSGLASTTATTPNGQPIDTAVAGAKTFAVVSTDLAGNVNSVVNTYTVLSPAQAAQLLVTTVTGLNLPNGTETSLTSKLDAAFASLQQGQNNAAVNQLNAFVNQVNAQRGKALTDEQANALIQAAQKIIAGITP